MSSEFDEAPVIASAVAGDREALARLLVEHSGPLTRRLAARLKLNPFADFSVEDVLQEVFLDVFRGFGTYRLDPGTPFRAWLRRVADNRLAAMLRKSSRAKRGGGRRRIHSVEKSPLATSIHDLVHHLADLDGETGSQFAARAEIVLAIREGLAALPEDQRASAQARYLEDRSLDATAADLAKTPGAVRGLLHRAKKSLRDALGQSSRWFYRR